MQHVHALHDLVSPAAAQLFGGPVLAFAVVLLTALYLTLAKKRPPGPRLLLPVVGETLAVKDDPCGYFVSR
jgi:hypothetical protein